MFVKIKSVTKALVDLYEIFCLYFRSNVAQTAKIKSTLCSWQLPIIPIEKLWSIARNFVSWQKGWLRNAKVQKENRSNGNIQTSVPLSNLLQGILIKILDSSIFIYFQINTRILLHFYNVILSFSRVFLSFPHSHMLCRDNRNNLRNEKTRRE